MSWLVALGLVLWIVLIAWLDAGRADEQAPDASPWGDLPDDDVGEGDAALPLVSEQGWAVPDAHRQLLRGPRWWTGGRDGSATMLVAADDDHLFGRRWNVYEVDGLEPLLIAAIPFAETPTIRDLLGEVNVEDVHEHARAPGGVRPWTPVPDDVDRSLAATAAWVGRSARVPQR